VLVGSIATLRYDLAVVTERDLLGASALFWLVALVSLMVFAVASVCLVALGQMDFLPASMQADDGVGLIVLWLFFFVVSQIFMVWRLRNAEFFQISVAQFANASIASILQIYGGMVLGGGAYWLILGSIAGQFAALSIFLAGSFRTGGRPAGLCECYDQMREMALKHRRFVQYTLPYTVFGAIRDRVPVMLVGVLATGREFGLYSQAWRLANVPAGLTGSIVRPVLFQSAAERGLASLESPVKRILMVVVLSGAPMLAALVYRSEHIFGWVLGEQWREIGPYMAALAFPALAFSLSNWMDRMLDTAGKQHLNLVAEMVCGISSTLGLALVLMSDAGLYRALVLQSVLLTLNYLFFVYLTFCVAGYARSFLLYLALLAVLVFGACMLLLQWLLPNLGVAL
jgi:O-antigen/teichoic acid export membrane protein